MVRRKREPEMMRKNHHMGASVVAACRAELARLSRPGLSYVFPSFFRGRRGGNPITVIVRARHDEMLKFDMFVGDEFVDD